MVSSYMGMHAYVDPLGRGKEKHLPRKLLLGKEICGWSNKTYVLNPIRRDSKHFIRHF